MSFRDKLLLAIIGVAAVTTIATMLPAQRALQATQENAIHDRFRKDVSLARRLDQERLAAVAARCQTLARSVRLVAAMQEGDTQLLYDNARDELREVLASPPARAATSTSLPRATFVRFVGPDAELAAPPSDTLEFGSLPQATQPLVQALRTALVSSHGLEHGWISFGRSQADLHRVVIAAIDDPVTLKRLGALVLGFEAAATFDAKDTDTTDEVSFGLLVGDDLHLDDLAPGDRERLVAVLDGQAAVAAPATAQGEFGLVEIARKGERRRTRTRSARNRVSCGWTSVARRISSSSSRWTSLARSSRRIGSACIRSKPHSRSARCCNGARRRSSRSSSRQDSLPDSSLRRACRRPCVR